MSKNMGFIFSLHTGRGIHGFKTGKATGKHGRLCDKQLTMSSSSRTVMIIKSVRIKWAEDVKCIKGIINEQYFVCRTPKHSAAQI
jgi:hypothetical protein